MNRNEHNTNNKREQRGHPQCRYQMGMVYTALGPGSWSWVLGLGSWVLGPGCWVLVLGPESWVLGPGPWVQH